MLVVFCNSRFPKEEVRRAVTGAILTVSAATRVRAHLAGHEGARLCRIVFIAVLAPMLGHPYTGRPA